MATLANNSQHAGPHYATVQSAGHKTLRRNHTNLRQKNHVSHRPYLLQNRVFKERITPKNTAFFFVLNTFNRLLFLNLLK
jgi:hypothetical protein